MLLVRSRHLWIAVALATTFWVSSRFAPTQSTLLATNSLMFAGSLAVSVAYFPYFWSAVRGLGPKDAESVTIGIWYSWTFGAIWRLHSIVWLRAGSPAYFVQNDLIAFYQSGIFLAAMYHVVSPGAIGGRYGEKIPSLKWIAVGTVVGVASFATLQLESSRADVRWLTDYVRPYIPGAD